MTNAPELSANSWERLVSIANHLDVGDPLACTYIFRGHEDFEWSLRPTIHRAATNDNPHSSLPSGSELLSLEGELTKRFSSVAVNHLSVAAITSSKAPIDWWTLMRHYGVPTRLVDWTQSFYVALYFAACRAPTKDGAVYILHARTLQTAMSEKHGAAASMPTSLQDSTSAFGSPEAPPIVHLFERRTALVDRMISQQGLFMASANIATELEPTVADAMTQYAGSGRELFSKLRISASLKPTIVRRLRSMNVTASALFPGLDGIGRQLDELVRHRQVPPNSALQRTGQA